MIYATFFMSQAIMEIQVDNTALVRSVLVRISYFFKLIKRQRALA